MSVFGLLFRIGIIILKYFWCGILFWAVFTFPTFVTTGLWPSLIDQLIWFVAGAAISVFGALIYNWRKDLAKKRF